MGANPIAAIVSESKRLRRLVVNQDYRVRLSTDTFTKKCCICKEEKPTIEFVRANFKKGLLQPYCRKCQAIYKRSRTDMYRKKLQPIFDIGCSICGEKDIATLEFHHIDKRQDTVGHLITGNYSWKKIIKELSKCICLCANCHKKTHYYKLDLTNLKRCSTFVEIT